MFHLMYEVKLEQVLAGAARERAALIPPRPEPVRLTCPVASGAAYLDAVERRTGQALCANARRLASWPWRDADE